MISYKMGAGQGVVSLSLLGSGAVEGTLWTAWFGAVVFWAQAAVWDPG